MGGTSGEFRGNSKIEVYLQYEEYANEHIDTFPDPNPNPKYKKLCKYLMEQDLETKEWILYYHLHK